MKQLKHIWFVTDNGENGLSCKNKIDAFRKSAEKRLFKKFVRLFIMMQYIYFEKLRLSHNLISFRWVKYFDDTFTFTQLEAKLKVLGKEGYD